MHLSFEVRVLYLEPFFRGGVELSTASLGDIGTISAYRMFVVQLASMVAAFSASDLSQILCHPGTTRVHEVC